mgnify:CR=1 FL=1
MLFELGSGFVLAQVVEVGFEGGGDLLWGGL